MNPIMVWEPRTYRDRVDAPGLVSFQVVHAETDLQVSAVRDLRAEALAAVLDVRAELERYIAGHPHFADTFAPVDVESGAPEIVRAMAGAGAVAGTGPMAAVAGAVAERVARAIAPLSCEVIVENGGDLYLIGQTSRRVLLVAGDSPLSGRLAIELDAAQMPVAVCTSSGKVGHSVSLGEAHAVTVLAGDGALADAVATATGNVVHGAGSIDRALARAMGVPGIRGAVIVVGDRVGAAGGIRFAPVAG